MNPNPTCANHVTKSLTIRPKADILILRGNGCEMFTIGVTMIRNILIFTSILVMTQITTARAELAGSAHDFSGLGFSQGQICLPCHAPHNTSTDVQDVPMWNHAVSTAVYNLYNSDTLDAGSTAGSLNQPTGPSKLCLSCHDGTIAIDAFGGNPGSQLISGTSNLGTDLSNDHPISFVYNTELALDDGSLRDPSTTLSGIAGSSGTILTDMLFGNRMECASCHDVHNKFGQPSLLLKSNTASALCLTCHNL